MRRRQPETWDVFVEDSDIERRLKNPIAAEWRNLQLLATEPDVAQYEMPKTNTASYFDYIKNEILDTDEMRKIMGVDIGKGRDYQFSTWEKIRWEYNPIPPKHRNQNARMRILRLSAALENWGITGLFLPKRSYDVVCRYCCVTYKTTEDPPYISTKQKFDDEVKLARWAASKGMGPEVFRYHQMKSRDFDLRGLPIEGVYTITYFVVYENLDSSLNAMARYLRKKGDIMGLRNLYDALDVLCTKFIENKCFSGDMRYLDHCMVKMMPDKLGGPPQFRVYYVGWKPSDLTADIWHYIEEISERFEKNQYTRKVEPLSMRNVSSEFLILQKDDQLFKETQLPENEYTQLIVHARMKCELTEAVLTKKFTENGNRVIVSEISMPVLEFLVNVIASDPIFVEMMRLSYHEGVNFAGGCKYMIETTWTSTRKNATGKKVRDKFVKMLLDKCKNSIVGPMFPPGQRIDDEDEVPMAIAVEKGDKMEAKLDVKLGVKCERCGKLKM